MTTPVEPTPESVDSAIPQTPVTPEVGDAAVAEPASVPAAAPVPDPASVPVPSEAGNVAPVAPEPVPAYADAGVPQSPAPTPEFAAAQVPTSQFPQVAQPAPVALGPDGLPLAPVKKKSKAVPILASVTAVLLLVTIVLGVLLISVSGTLNKTKTDDAATIAALTAEAEKNKDAMAELQTKLDDSETDLEDAQTAIGNCLDEVENFLLAIANQDKTALNKAAQNMSTECAEADKFR